MPGDHAKDPRRTPMPRLGAAVITALQHAAIIAFGVIKVIWRRSAAAMRHEVLLAF